MALSKYTLRQAFYHAIIAEINAPLTPKERIEYGIRSQKQKDSADRVAKAMSDAVDLFVKSATVVTVGSAATQTSAPGGIT